MTTSGTDQRSPERRVRDDQIGAEPQKPPLELPRDAAALPLEVHLGKLRQEDERTRRQKENRRRG